MAIDARHVQAIREIIERQGGRERTEELYRMLNRAGAHALSGGDALWGYVRRVSKTKAGCNQLMMWALLGLGLALDIVPKEARDGE